MYQFSSSLSRCWRKLKVTNTWLCLTYSLSGEKKPSGLDFVAWKVWSLNYIKVKFWNEWDQHFIKAHAFTFDFLSSDSQVYQAYIVCVPPCNNLGYKYLTKT